MLNQDLESKTLQKPTTYKLFKENLNHAKLNRNKELLTLISAQDLENIYNYFLKDDNPFAETIKNLEPNQSLRLDKHATGLARTLNILRTKEKEFILILETKSKLANGKKQELLDINGGYKTGKPAWRLDGDVKTYFNLVSIIANDESYKQIKKEARIAKQFDSPYLDTKELGPIYTKNGLRKISVYSEKAISDLFDFRYYNTAFEALTLKQKYDLLLDLFHGVEELHDKEMVHQDLKCENILVYADGKTGYHLKLTDFGTVRRENSKHFSEFDASTWGFCGSTKYQSPEILNSYSRVDNPSVAYYENYFNHAWKNITLSTLAHKHYYNVEQSEKLYLKPHPANDMWALGLIVYEILYYDVPLEFDQNIEKNHLVKGLLEPHRENRLTIKEALVLLREKRAQAEQDEQAEQLAKALTQERILLEKENAKVKETENNLKIAELRVKEKAEIKAEKVASKPRDAEEKVKNLQESTELELKKADEEKKAYEPHQTRIETEYKLQEVVEKLDAKNEENNKLQAQNYKARENAQRIKAEAINFTSAVIASSTVVALTGGAQTIGGLLFEAGTASALPAAGLVGISLATGFALTLTATGLIYSVNAFYNWYTQPIDKHKPPHANETTSPIHDNSNLNASPGQNVQHCSMLSKLLTFSWSSQRSTVPANDTQKGTWLFQECNNFITRFKLC